MSNEEAQPTTKSDPPHSKAKLFVEKLNVYRNIILAVATLATAVGSWLKPTDTTATERSFDWTTKKVEELSKNDVQMHDDIVAIRGYLEGMKAAQQPVVYAPAAVAPAVAPAVTAPAVAAPAVAAPSRLAGVPARRRRSPAALMEVLDQVLEEAPMPQQTEAPELPTLKADPHPMKRPSFEDIALE